MRTGFVKRETIVPYTTVVYDHAFGHILHQPTLTNEKTTPSNHGNEAGAPGLNQH